MGGALWEERNGQLQIPPLRYGMTKWMGTTGNVLPVTEVVRDGFVGGALWGEAKRAAADSSASLRNDKWMGTTGNVLLVTEVVRDGLWEERCGRSETGSCRFLRFATE